MAECWIVSRGSYSDYNVVAVFTDKAKADAYMARLVPPDVRPEDIGLHGDYQLESGLPLNPDPDEGQGVWYAQRSGFSHRPIYCWWAPHPYPDPGDRLFAPTKAEALEKFYVANPQDRPMVEGGGLIP